MLELPKNTPDLVDTGLMLFREVGENLTIEAQAVERERGVVLSEMRTRDTPEFRAYKARSKVWYEGQLLADRMPIGTKEDVEGATRELIEEYYHRNYQPERAFLIVTGDIDQASTEKLIADIFGSWKGVGPNVADPDLGTPKQRSIVATSHIEPNLAERLTVTWFQPSGWEADTLEVRVGHSRWWMATAILNRRLERLARAEKPPFVSASVGRGENRGISNTFGMSVATKPGNWQRGMAAANQEVRRALEHGFTEGEIRRELKEWRASLEDAAGSASTRTTSDLASEIASDFSDGHVFTHPGVQLAIFEKYAPTLSPANVLAGLKEVVQGNGPVIVLTSNEPVQGGDAAIASAYEASSQVPVAEITRQDSKDFPYTSFGTAGTVTGRQHLDDLDVSLIQFSNGVRLNFKKTGFEKDTINVAVRFAGGLLALHKSKPGTYWMLPFSFSEGGLQKLTTDELEESTAGKIVGASLGLDDDAFEFDGKTRPQDMLLQMQLLAAYATDPAYRSNGLERLQASAESDLRSFSSSSGRVLFRESSGLLHSGDKRWAFPTLAQLQAIKMTDVKSAISPALADAPIEITVVGDINEDEVIKAVSATFAALPKRLTRFTEPAGARSVHFPSASTRVAYEHEGSVDQASAFVAWPTQEFYADRRKSRAITLMKEMIQVRLTDEFREAQGATYSPSAQTSFSTTYPGYGFLEASAETKPELVENFYKTLDRVVDEMKSGKFTDDLIDRARTPVVKNLEKSRLSNGYWQGALGDIQTEPRSIETIRTQIQDYADVTRQEIVDVANRFLVQARRIEIRVLPKKKQAMREPSICSFPAKAYVKLQLKVAAPCDKAA